MRILVDSTIWSVSLRAGRSHPEAARLRHQIVTGSQVYVLGIVLQEVLQGIQDPRESDMVFAEMSDFEMLSLTVEDYLAAAELHKTCRARGVSGGTIDCLIAAAAIGHKCRLHSLDDDFKRIARFSELELF